MLKRNILGNKSITEELISEKNRNTIPSLFDISLNIIKKDINHFKHFENVPKVLHTKLFEHLSPKELNNIELKNKKYNVILNTNRLWKTHCENEFSSTIKDFKKYKAKNWKDLFRVCTF